MKRICIMLSAAALVAGCADGGLGDLFRKRPAPTAAPQAAAPDAETQRPQARPEARSVLGAGGARTADSLDTTSEAEKAAAAGASGGRALGVTIASLGAPSEPGFWLKTPLVKAPARGRVEYPETGQSAEVDLIPLDGPATGGSQMSLAAMRLIGAPLAGLPEVRVFRLGS
ncbi:hypothetical protein D6850_08960 [Roseovarius spongiae]|uniref:D-galactarate dehydratase n=1 Tax=Roseovarius spongiae TaxID=2320272 RepID=A0A3A8AWC0_9RHOB|nr:hypothetical protein [Roseovarius spongiae]RKF14980.1 hypothetical protein D6850_08960 [Roseovarius spongiae]